MYEFVKPAEKNVQTLHLHENGTVTFTEVGNKPFPLSFSSFSFPLTHSHAGETGIEKWSSKGHGVWKVVPSDNGDVVQVTLQELSKKKKAHDVLGCLR